MKRMISLTLVVLVALSLFACDQPNNDTETTDTITTAVEETTTEAITTEETTEEKTTLEETTTEPEDLKQNWDEDGVLKILCIGNSFSVDAMEYLYGVLSDLGIENIKLGNLAIGGCSISMHYNNAKSDDAAYIYRENTTGVWSEGNGYIMSDIIESENWDFISLQQASHDSGVESTYRRLSALITTIESWCPGARLVWHMTWAYQQDSTHGSFPIYNSDQMTMYKRIISTVQEKIATEPAIETIVPCGTAIQNARAGWIGDTLTRDGFHLSNLGRYIAALTFAQTLTGISIENVTYGPSGFTTAEQELAIEAAMLAIAKPFEVSTPTTEDTTKEEDDNEQTTESQSQAVVDNFEECNDTVCVLVGSTAANLRTSPSMNDSAIATSVENGTELERVAVSNDGWSKVVYNDETYYLKTACVVWESMFEGFVAATGTVTLSAPFNVRIAPSTNNDAVGTLVAGDTIEVIAVNETTGWYKINYDGTYYTGEAYVYIDSDYMEGEVVVKNEMAGNETTTAEEPITKTHEKQ